MAAISAEEYATWLQPEAALNRLPDDWGIGHSRDAFNGHLMMGEIRSVAKAGLLGSEDGQDQRVEYYQLPAELWVERDWQRRNSLWVTGQISFHRGSRLVLVAKSNATPPYHEHTFTGVRFDPKSLEVLYPQAHPIVKAGSDAFASTEAAARRGKCSTDDAERVSRAILAGWPETNEKDAYEKAKRFYPDRAISRDWFLGIFRAIRGRKSRGKQPKTSD